MQRRNRFRCRWITTFIRGTITNNTSGKHGGGIACGEAGENGQSKLYMSDMTISNNTCTESGGGIWTPNNIQGTGTEYDNYSKQPDYIQYLS